MLINETVVLIDAIDLFCNYVVVKNLFIAVGFVNEVLCLRLYRALSGQRWQLETN